MSDKDVCRRWTIAIAQLRNRAAKVRRVASPEVIDVLDQSLGLCDSVVRDLAGTGLQFDAFKLKLDSQTVLWSHLFEEMPSPCIETDSSGIIFNANRAAASMLNTSVKHLGARLLLHFAEDREHFGRLIRGLTPDGGRQRATLTIRPRERAPIAVDATVIARTPGDSSSWLWFLMPPELPQAGSRHEKVPERLESSPRRAS